MEESFYLPVKDPAFGPIRGPITPCKYCSCETGFIAEGKGPHFASIRCVKNFHFIKWLGKNLYCLLMQEASAE